MDGVLSPHLLRPAVVELGGVVVVEGVGRGQAAAHTLAACNNNSDVRLE